MQSAKLKSVTTLAMCMPQGKRDRGAFSRERCCTHAPMLSKPEQSNQNHAANPQLGLRSKKRVCYGTRTISRMRSRELGNACIGMGSCGARGCNGGFWC